MDQKQITTSTHSVSDLETLRLQLEEDRRLYCDNRNSQEVHERLLHTLQTNDCREIITAVVDGDDLASAFVRAGNRCHTDILEAFFNHGININIKDQKGWTALIGASYNEDKGCVRFLLDHNADVNLQSKNGYTALMIASQYGNIEIVEMLLKKNANPDLQDKKGMTALMYASEHCCREIVELLLNHGADIELKDIKGKTALDLAKNEEIKEPLQNYVTNSYVLK